MLMHKSIITKGKKCMPGMATIIKVIPAIIIVISTTGTGGWAMPGHRITTITPTGIAGERCMQIRIPAGIIAGLPITGLPFRQLFFCHKHNSLKQIAKTVVPHNTTVFYLTGWYLFSRSRKRFFLISQMNGKKPGYFCCTKAIGLRWIFLFAPAIVF